MKTFRPWGVNPSSVLLFSRDYTCPNRKCKSPVSFFCGGSGLRRSATLFRGSVVGFAPSTLCRAGNDSIIGAVVIRCPGCELEFGVHLTMHTIGAYQNDCSNWPPLQWGEIPTPLRGKIVEV
jgi:hypothetical protein